MSETPPICWENFTAFEALFSVNDFRDLISLSLSDIDVHLERIAHFRAERDFEAVAREADAVAWAAANLGALQVGTAAHRLETACRHGHHAVTYRLISELAQACSDADALMRSWLESQSTLPHQI